MKNYEEIKKIINAYSRCPRIFMLSHVSGLYNLIIGIVGQNIETLQRYKPLWSYKQRRRFTF